MLGDRMNLFILSFFIIHTCLAIRLIPQLNVSLVRTAGAKLRQTKSDGCCVSAHLISQGEPAG